MTIFERLVQVFESVFEQEVNTGSLTPDSKLREDVGLNSIGFLYMALALEEEFSVKFTNSDFADLVTVNNVIELLQKKGVQ